MAIVPVPQIAHVKLGFFQGFALGLLLSAIEVLIAHLNSDNKKLARARWLWINFGVSVLFYLLILIFWFFY